MLCHAGFAGLAGGFIGVDMFFTISGFVVANSIFRDLDAGRFSLTAFYARRARRLGPALYLVLATTFLFSLLFRFPDDAFRLAKNMLAIATFTSNIYLSKQTGYFDAASLDQPLLHTWSLSVEEQFYLGLPLLLLACRGRSRAVTIGLLAAIAALSFGFALASSSPPQDSAAYYLAHNRAFEFLIGVLLAIWETRRRAGKSAIFDVLYAGSVMALIYGVTAFSRASPFPGTAALLPCVSTAIAIYSASRSRFLPRFLINPALAAFGRISYPAYLWHWPILFAFRRFGFSDPKHDVLAIILTCLLAALTYLMMERKAQRAPLIANRALMTYLATPLLCIGVLTGIGKLSEGFLFAYPASIQQNIRWSGTALFDMPRADACWSKVGFG